MTDVACYCGHRYSLDDEVGVCPQCGATAALPHAPLPQGALLAEGFSQADLAGATRQAIQKMVAVGRDRSRR